MLLARRPERAANGDRQAVSVCVREYWRSHGNVRLGDLVMVLSRERQTLDARGCDVRVCWVGS